MNIMIESTDRITKLDGAECRVWNGVTERGVKCILFIHRIALYDEEDSSQFAAELAETLPPGRSVPLSTVLADDLERRGLP